MKHKKSITERIDGAIDYIDRFNVYLNSSDHLLSVIMKKHNNTLSDVSQNTQNGSLLSSSRPGITE